jgi:hypothetical protein
MRYPHPSRDNKLLAISRLRLRAAVGLSTGHTTLIAHLYKLGHTEQQDSWLCGCNREDSVHIVCDCPVLACKKHRTWGGVFLRPKDLHKVGILLSIVANTRLDLVP